MNYLIYVPNDYVSTFCVAEKFDGNLKNVEFYFDWMVERGSFYRFFYETDFTNSLALLSALNIPAFGFPVDLDSYQYYDITFIRGFYFNEFSPIVLSKWFSSTLSSSFDNNEMFDISNFKSCTMLGPGSLTNRAVRRFSNFSDFDHVMQDFLFRYKNISSSSISFMPWTVNEEFDTDYVNYIDCF